MKKVSFILFLTLLIATVLTACQPAEVAPAEDVITDTELNVLCTPQEQWCQGMKQDRKSVV